MIGKRCFKILQIVPKLCTFFIVKVKKSPERLLKFRYLTKLSIQYWLYKNTITGKSKFASITIIEPDWKCAFKKWDFGWQLVYKFYQAFYISLSTKLDFVKSMIDIMPEDDSKAAMVTIFKNSTFLFLYDIRKTTLSEFWDLCYFDVKNFRPDTKVGVEMQIYSQNFKPKRRNKGSQSYSFKLMSMYKL